MPSVASQVSASQQSRLHQSDARSRSDSSDRSQNSPFSELLPSTAPAPEPRPGPRNARTDKSDAPRSTDNSRKTDAPADRKAPNETKDAGDVSDAANAKDAKDTKSADGDTTAKDAKAGDDAAKTAGSDDGTTTATKDTDAERKPDATLAAALAAATTQPVIVAPQPVASDAPAAEGAAASGAAAQIDALVALQAAEQKAMANEAKPTAKGDGSDELKADAKDKKEIKADAKALTGTKTDATADAKSPAAQPQSGQDGDAEQQNGGKASHDVRQGAAKAAGEHAELETRGHHATDISGAAKAGAAVTATSVDAAAAAAAASNAAAGSSAAPAQPQTLTPAHIQAGLQAQDNAAAAIPLTGVAVEIAAQASAGKQHFEIRLDPAELGRIDVKLDIDSDGNTTTRLFVERSDTLELLKRDSGQLEHALQQAGLKTSDNAMEFSLRQQFAQSDDQGASKTAKIVVPDDEATRFSLQRQNYGRLLGSGSGLDIRV